MTRSIPALLFLALLLNSCMTGRALNYTQYLPRDLTDCFQMLDSVLPSDKRAQIRANTETQFAEKSYLGLGKWIANNWWLRAEGDLYRNFLGLGITHFEDMTDIILTSYHRYLSNRPLAIPEQVERAKAYRQHISLQRLVFDSLHLAD